MSNLELSGSVREQLSVLRLLLVKARHELIEAEAELAEEQSAVHAFRIKFRQRIGDLVDAVQALQDEMQGYMARLQQIRLARELGISFKEAAEAIREAEKEAGLDGDTVPPTLDEDEAAEMKRLYRQLARRFHPDFADDEADRAHRTHMMSLVNDAYGAHKIDALRELLNEPVQKSPTAVHETEAQIVQKLRAELARCRRRRREIEGELADLRQQHVTQLWRDAVEADARGRDLLSEIERELKHKRARMEAERDFLKVQFEELGATEAE